MQKARKNLELKHAKYFDCKLDLILFSGVFLLPCFSAVAQSNSLSAQIQAGNNSISSELSSQADSSFKERKALEKRISPMRNSPVAPAKLNPNSEESESESDSDDDEPLANSGADTSEKLSKAPDAAGFSEAQFVVPNVQPANTMRQRKSPDGKLQFIHHDLSTPSLIPRAEKVPPAVMSAFLGQALSLSVQLKKIAGTESETQVAWYVGGKPLCHGEACDINLDGKRLNVGTHELTIVIFNGHGSSKTRHFINVIQGTWNPTLPFAAKSRKKISNSEIEFVDKSVSENELRISALVGAGAYASSQQFMVVGSVPRAIDWVGRFKAGAGASLRLQDPTNGEWFLVGGTDLQFIPPAVPNSRILKIRSGSVRYNAPNGVKKDVKDRKLLDRIALQTEELSVTPSEGSDIYLARIAPVKKQTGKNALQNTSDSSTPSDKWATHVVVLGGSAQITIAKGEGGKSKILTLPPGVEFIVFSDGRVAPLGKPNVKRMEKLYRLTTTPEDLAEVARLKAAHKNIDIKAHLKKIDALLDREDFFEVLQELTPLEDRFQENFKIAYYFGLANKGVYQNDEAERWFKIAAKQNDKNVLPLWQLAQMRLEEKKWPEARRYLDESYAKMSSADPQYLEYFYYSGVTEFNLGNDFAARADFTRALWQAGLDNALKGSAAGFLQSLSKRKSWNAVGLMGAQYDGNALGLAASDPVNPPFKRRYVMRSISGLIFNYDPAAAGGELGLHWGGGMKAIALRNFSNTEFHSLNATVGELNSTQTYIYKNSEVPSAPAGAPAAPFIVQKVTEALGMVWVDGKWVSASVNIAFSKEKIEASAAFNFDPVGKLSENKNAFNFRQVYGFGIFASPKMTSDLDIALDESYVLHKSIANGHSIGYSITPSVSFPISPRLITKLSLLIGSNSVFLTPIKTEYKTNATLGCTYFIMPWLMVISSVNDEFTIKKTEGKSVNKPGASVIFTGIF